MIKNYFFILTGCFSFFFSSIDWAADAPVPQSGQTISYGTNDDGALRKGIASPSPRFTDLGNGTVTDALTGLMWMKNASCWSFLGWSAALTKITDLNSGSATCSGYSGTYTDWRLPNRSEMMSLMDYGRSNPPLPSGHPFSGVQIMYYLTSTTYSADTSRVWTMFSDNGSFNHNVKAGSYYIWPVRGGQ
ncbi:MAG: DUF1566 domain-containing protein [Magnetococcales bacterium]|nr:DUF1566 domain-containing protein [Magnetococcales bacterium]